MDTTTKTPIVDPLTGKPTGSTPITNTPTTLSATDIGSTTPLTVPTVQPDSLGNLVKSYDAINQKNTADQNALNSDYTNLLTQFGNQTTDYQNALTNAGGDTFTKELSDLSALQTQQTADYLGGLNTIGGKAISREAQSVGEAAVQRKHGIDALLTSSLIQAKQGQLTAAQDTAQRAINAKYEPLKAQIEAKKFLLDQINTKAAEDRKTALNLQLKQIEEQQKKDETVQNMIIDANAQGAPQSVIKNAQDIASKGGSLSQIAAAFGSYTGAAAKAELLREQIKTEKAQQAKFYNDIRSSGTGSNKLLSPTEAKDAGVPYGTTEGQLIAQNLANQGKPLPLNGVQTQALTSAKQLLDSLNNNFGFFKQQAPIGINKLALSLPGTHRKDFIIQFNNLKSLLSLDNVKLLKGQGSVSDAERQLLSDASTKLNRSQSPEEFKKTLTDIITTFNKATPEYQYVDTLPDLTNQSSISASDYAKGL